MAEKRQRHCQKAKLSFESVYLNKWSKMNVSLAIEYVKVKLIEVIEGESGFIFCVWYNTMSITVL